MKFDNKTLETMDKIAQEYCDMINNELRFNISSSKEVNILAQKCWENTVLKYSNALDKLWEKCNHNDDNWLDLWNQAISYKKNMNKKKKVGDS
jgi:hypothetical protein